MKIHLAPHYRSAGYALVIVLAMTAISAIMLASAMSRTTSVAKLNERNNQYVVTLNAAEAATEKVFARMAYDFSSFGLGAVANNISSGLYATNIPNENAYWNNFEYSDGQGHSGRIAIFWITNYTGALPSQYDGLVTAASPVYRILANVRMKNTRYNFTNAVQEDIMLALVPITTYAIFYNGLLEFSQCAPMEVRGRVHSNTNIYVGTLSSSSLSFYSAVSASGTVTKPSLKQPNNTYASWGTGGTSSLKANTYFYGGTAAAPYAERVPTVSISIPMTNSHTLVDIPVTNVVGSAFHEQRLYNLAQVLLVVSNSTVTAQIRAAPSATTVPGADSSPITITSGTNATALSTNMPFLTLTNTFYDQRESKNVVASQIDVGKYGQWLKTNSAVSTKFPAGSGTYPTILYVADNRTASSTKLPAVRITNGAAPPVNGNLGFSLATPNPLYVWGNYNQTNNSLLSKNDTSQGTVPCALMSDSLTVLSSAWQDSKSTSSFTYRSPANTTINAAIITGNVPSTGLTSTTFSGGVHNLTRMLENWSGHTLTLNTSIVSLFGSTKATNQWQWQGTYYQPPTRLWAFDQNFMDPTKQPPGVPTALVPIRYNWGVPPPNTTNYVVTP
ncbi:MAG TPA: hypothetical protein VL527_02225 [Dongiaceae bacterium]|jgi:hypothetical protein|nr:hypothetical protein [Dongiaceae bacterium]